MLRLSLSSCALLLLALVCPPVTGQQFPLNNHGNASAAKSDDGNMLGGVEILSDTGGVDVGPYIKQIVGMIYKNWTPLIPSEARPPESKPGDALIRFKILPDGRLNTMWLDGSSHDDAINRACWGAITAAGQFPPLPTAMGSTPLELRIHFYVNMKPQ